MPIVRSGEGEKEGIMQVSRLMLVSARTAPKSGGVDDLLTAIVSGFEKESLAAEMNKIAEEKKIDGFYRAIRNSYGYHQENRNHNRKVE